MVDELQIDEEKHDLIKKVAELQKQLEEINNYNNSFTELKSIVRMEILATLSYFIEDFKNTDKYNNIFDLDKILTFCNELHDIIGKEIKNG